MKEKKNDNRNEMKQYIKTLRKESDADIKRYIGAISEDFQGKVSAVAEQFGGLNIKVDKITASIDKINTTLDSHTHTLDSHTHILNSHTHMIVKLAEDMTIVKTDFEFIKVPYALGAVY